MQLCRGAVGKCNLDETTPRAGSLLYKLAMTMDGEGLFFVAVAPVFTTGLSFLASLVLGLLLLTGELALDLGLGDVAEGINGLLLVLLLNLCLVLWDLALDGELTVVHEPFLLGQGIRELVVMRNHDDTTLELLYGGRKSTERVAIQVVRRFIEHQDVRVQPHGGSQDDLHLLTTRKTTHARVGTEFSAKAEVVQVLLDGDGSHWASLQVGAGSFAIIGNLEQLVPAPLLELLTRNPRVLVNWELVPLDLVLETLLELTTRDNLLERTLLALPVHWKLELGLLLRSELTRLLGKQFLVLTGLETPLDVLVGSDIQVLFNVMEGVLGDIGETHARVLPHSTHLWLNFTSQHLDHGRLTGTVRAEHSDTAGQGARDRHVVDRWLVTARVRVGTVRQTNDWLTLVLDVGKETWLWELEGEGRGLKLVVRLSLWLHLHELRKVALVDLELAVLVVDDVRAHVVEEAGVVGHHDRRHVWQTVQVVLQPGDVVDIQVVRRFIEQQDISLHQHGTSQFELHLPTTRKGTDWQSLHLGGEADAAECVDDLLARGLGEFLVAEHELNDWEVGLLSLEVVLNEHGLELLLGGEAFELTVGNGAHERRLTATVRTAETITVTTLEAKTSVVQQDHTTVSQGKLTVAKIWNALIAVNILNDDRLVLLVTEVTDDVGDGLRVLDERLEVGADVLLERRLVEVASNNQEETDARHVVEDSLVDVGVLARSIGRNGLVNDAGDVLEVNLHVILGHFNGTTGNEQGAVGAGGDFTALRISDGVDDLLEARQQLWHEQLSFSWVVHELAHIVNDDSGLTLDSGLAFLQGTLEQRFHDSKSWRFDRLDECRRGKLVRALSDFRWVGHAADQGWDERLNIHVANDVADLGQGLLGGNLDIGTGVPHAVSDDWDDVWQETTNLVRSDRRQLGDQVEGDLLGLPLLGAVKTGEEDWQDTDGKVLVRRADDGQGSFFGGRAHGHLLVGEQVKQVLQQWGDIWLHALGVLLHQVGDDIRSDNLRIGIGADKAILELGSHHREASVKCLLLSIASWEIPSLGEYGAILVAAIDLVTTKISLGS
ncbi:TPA: hypothetical protein N0F65_001195, partial [Lagenidium giganteum]